jgi:hypothetical protein
MRAPRRRLLAIACSAAGTVACGAGASADPGLSSLLRVQGAQFAAGAPPAPSSDGPKVASVLLPTTTIWPGYADKPFSGALDPSATAVAIALSGDDGYWILRAGVPDFSAPTLPTFHGLASFATTLAPGQFTFQVRAIDGEGVFGPPSNQILTAVAAAPSAPAPQGELVVTLTWDTESDLDLHVVDPLATEIYHGNPSSMPPPSAGPTPADGGSYGYLDVDSNAQCIIDGLRREDVVWLAAPPSGRYFVRVDTASLCGQPIANFAVRTVLRGTAVAEARGVALDSDTWGPHDRGAGRLVLTFDVP